MSGNHPHGDFFGRAGDKADMASSLYHEINRGQKFKILLKLRRE